MEKISKNFIELTLTNGQTVKVNPLAIAYVQPIGKTGKYKIGVGNTSFVVCEKNKELYG